MSEPGGAQRLQKVLAAAGVGSRRACEELITAGRVTVDGEVAELGSSVDPTAAEVRVDGERINVAPDRLYVMLNKPQGVVTTARDPQGRPTVVDLVELGQRLFPVGRLDLETEGLVLLTNDGPLAHALTHPSYEVERHYVALVRGRATRRVLQQLRAGVELEDGPAVPVRVGVLGEEGGQSLVEVVLTEGRKHEVRRLLAAVGLPVERLARVAYAGVELGDLRQGRWRHLNQAEIGRLFAAVEGNRPRRPGARPAHRGRPGGDRSTRRPGRHSGRSR